MELKWQEVAVAVAVAVAGSYSESAGNGLDPGGGCSELAWRALELGGRAG